LKQLSIKRDTKIRFASPHLGTLLLSSVILSAKLGSCMRIHKLVIRL